MQKLENVVENEQLPKTNKSLVRKIYDFGSKYIDYRMGLGGAVIMGSIVFGINYHETHEVLGSTTAALKQGGYTFLFGGTVMRGCEYLATRISNRTKALIASVIIPSVVSISLTYGMHNLKGTPRPEESTIPTVVIVIPATAIWGYRKRKQLEVKDINPS